MPVGELPGVGYQTTRRLQEAGINTCGDLRKRSLNSLEQDFKEATGGNLYRYCRGLDDRPLQAWAPPKTLAVEISWGVRFEADEGVKASEFVVSLAREIFGRLRTARMLAASVTVTLMKRAADAPVVNPYKVQIHTCTHTHIHTHTHTHTRTHTYIDTHTHTHTHTALIRRPRPHTQVLGHGKCDKGSRSQRLASALGATEADCVLLEEAVARMYCTTLCNISVQIV
jgi:nucleotidyltransferase/DNA polymerase involved in DNA repair